MELRITDLIVTTLGGQSFYTGSDIVRCVSQRPSGLHVEHTLGKGKARKMLPCHYPSKGRGWLRPLLCQEALPHHFGSPGFPLLNLPTASVMCPTSQESLPYCLRGSQSISHIVGAWQVNLLELLQPDGGDTALVLGDVQSDGGG